MFSDVWNKVRELVRKLLPKKSIEEVFQVNPFVSDRMADAIQLWSDMYEGHSPWIKEPGHEDPTRIVSLGLPALIASEKARMVTIEMKSEISAPMETVETENPTTAQVGTDDKSKPSISQKDVVPGQGISPSSAFQQTKETRPTGPTERAEFLNAEYKKLLKKIRRQLEYGIAKGGIIIKPYVVIYDKDVQNQSEETQNKAFSSGADEQSTDTTTGNASTQTSGKQTYSKELAPAEFEFDFVQADRFFPLSFDANEKLTEAAFVQIKVDKAVERVYIRLEHHKLERRKVTVSNLAFESTDMGLADSNNLRSTTNLGKQIPLSQVPEWADFKPTTVIENVDRLLFAYFKMPEANTVDPYSPLGVSGYSRVIQLIKDADMQYSRMLWEFEAGEMAIDVDRDALKFVDDGNAGARSILPEKQQRLFRKVDLNAEDTYNVFAPPLRDASLTAGLNTIFMRIEDATGLSRGTLSDVNTVEAKTATELKILKQRSYSTNADIQQALQDALEDVVYVMDVYCTLYEITPDGDYETSFEWDDSIIVDSESELSKRITLMQNGLASKLETRMWYFGETENQAKEALRQIDEEASQAMMQNAQAEQMKMAMTGGMIDSEQGSEDMTKSPADKTASKKSTGEQADSLDNPDKSKTADQIKTKK